MLVTSKNGNKVSLPQSKVLKTLKMADFISLPVDSSPPPWLYLRQIKNKRVKKLGLTSRRNKT